MPASHSVRFSTHASQTAACSSCLIQVHTACIADKSSASIILSILSCAVSSIWKRKYSMPTAGANLASCFDATFSKISVGKSERPCSKSTGAYSGSWMRLRL